MTGDDGGSSSGGTGGGSGGHGSSGSGSGSSGGSASGGSSSGGTSTSGSGGGSGSSSGGTSGTSSSGGSSSGGPVSWPSDACKAMTANLLGQMSRQQKAGQMVLALNPPSGDQMNLQPGSVFVGGSDMPPTGNAPQDWASWTDGFFQIGVGSPQRIPEIFGADSVHGVNHPSGTTIFPHNAGLASSRDAALVTQVGHITALESAALGMTMTYAPQASVAWDSRWGRFYESFSEDVDWAAEMVQAEVVGLQGAGGLGTGTPGIIACAKHWAGDGQGTAGTSHTGGVVDRSDIQIDLPTMEKYGFAAYLPAIASGLGCMMITDTTWNGQWVTSSHQMVTDLLKTMYGFQGIAMTDWNAQAAAGGYDAVVNAGIDMLMQPTAWQDAVNAIAGSSNIPDSRIDDAVTRILNVKCQAGLFNFQRDPSLLASVGSADHRAVARKAVAESLVVLQNNNNVLPLKKGSNIWVGGGGADSLDIQCGGWTINWQGAGNQTQGTTIAQAIGKVASPASSMAGADAIVVVLGEAQHAETPGDSPTINTIPGSDFTTLQQARASGKPVIAIILSGRPVQIADNLTNADAWIAGWLPGTEGDGVADILFGDVHPTGKLSHSWPKDDSQDNLMTCCNGNYTPLFPLGFGLTY